MKNSKKVILITGASSGIGEVTANFLSQKEFVVYGTSRNPNKGDYSYKVLQLDLNDSSSIKKCIEEVIAIEGQLDVLINNAGMGITGPIEETPSPEIKRVFETNLFGPIEVMKSVLPQMRKQNSGLIINITSIAGYMGLPFRGVYSATKGALETISESIRMEVKEFGINITTIAPGDFATNIAAGRFHTPVLNESPYKVLYKKNLELMDAHVDEGNDPIEMAEKIYDIINKTNPKVHYRVGSFLQKFSIYLKYMLPDKWYEKMIMNHYDMKS